MFKSATLLLAGIAFAAAQDYGKIQTIEARTSDPKVTISYWVDYNNTANPTLNQRFDIVNWDVSQWTSSGIESSLWVAIGWDNDDFKNTDMGLCTYLFSNSSSNDFLCMDGKGDSSGSFISEDLNNM